MKSIIKWGATTLARVAEAGKVAVQQVSYMGKAARVSTWTPYGLDSSPPKGKLSLLLSILGNPDNQVGLVGSPGEGPELAETEVVLFHPETGSKAHFLADGSISVVAGETSILLTAAGGILITPGAVPVTIDGDLVVTGDATLGAVVTSNGKDISDTHLHAAGTLLDSVAGAVTGSTAVPT